MVDIHHFEDGGAVVGDLDLALVPAHAPQDLVHPLRPEGRLDEVADGHGADEGGETRSLGPLLVRVVLHDPDGVEGDHLDAVCLGRSEKFVEIR